MPRPKSSRSTLDPTLDVVFKMLFASPAGHDSLMSLLTAVLKPPSPIVEITVLNPEISPAQVEDKSVVLDLLVRLADGTLLNVEMQTEGHKGLEGRVVYYWARAYGGQLERGGPYTALRPVISVLFLNDRLLPGDRLHSTFRILEVHDGTPLTDAFELHVVELPKRALASEATRQAEPALLAWSKFLGARTDQEVKEACVDHPDIEKANQLLAHLSMEPSAKALAEQRELGRIFQEMEMAAVKDEGRSEGRSEGIREGRIEVLLELLRTKFGGFDHETESRVRAASDSAITRWSRNILTASTLREALSEGGL